MISDEEIMRRLKEPRTRRSAFEDMVKKYSSQLYWQIRHVVLVHEDSDDVLQNTFLKAWSGLDQFRGDSKLSTWLYRIAINESMNFLQRRQLRSTVSLDDEEASPMVFLEGDPYFDGDETDLMLQRAIATLPEKQRIVFNMKYFQEMKYEKMSEVLNTSVGALKASYHLAVEKIEKYFNEHD